MADLWYQLGNQLNVEVEEIQESEETKDTKEQMRSLLQLCSDEGVTILQLEEALEALDQKNLIPGNLTLTMFIVFSFDLKVCRNYQKRLSRIIRKSNVSNVIVWSHT